MEMPEQELPVVFSQMLQMFPNIPQEIIWLYVQQYSRDIEKCAHMLNLQNSKYTGLKSTLNTSKNLNECKNVLQTSGFMLNSEPVVDNNNDVSLPTQLQLPNNEEDVINKCVTDRQKTADVAFSSSSQFSFNAIPGKNHVDSPINQRETKFINFNEPLVLDIVPDDDDDVSHSWRPNVSADIMCSDFFAPSRMSENFHLNSNVVPTLNFERKSEVILNPKGTNQEPWGSSNNSLHMFYDYGQRGERRYEEDITSYLHYQKSQMNVIRYEVIKAKIEQSDLKEEIETLSSDLKEKMHSKSVLDIEELNKEIVQLRLECQCLCTDVDQISNDQSLLGEVDEMCWEKDKSSSNGTDSQSVACSRCTNSHAEDSADAQDDSNRWQCSKCTFANHSAISACEMCSAPKPNTQRQPYVHAPPSSCYCHPKEKSLSVQS